MRSNPYLLLKNDKLKYMLLNWNKEEFTVQNKLQVLKELLDATADYIYQKNGMTYSEESHKYTIFATSEEYYEIDKKNLAGRTIVVFQEDLKESKGKYEILSDFALKMGQVIEDNIFLASDEAYVLRDISLNDYTKLQLDVSKENMSKKGEL